eukprot:3033608-Pleurochrysis_carterae.AAC.1
MLCACQTTCVSHSRARIDQSPPVKLKAARRPGATAAAAPTRDGLCSHKQTRCARRARTMTSDPACFVLLA